MTHTFNKQNSNPVSFDLFLNSTKDSRQKKSNIINPNTKILSKQGIISGSKGHNQTNTIFNNYNKFPSLSKCLSKAKLSKTHHSSNVSSKSFMSFPQKRHASPSPQTNLRKICNNEKSFSTTQSTDERKELNRLRTELKEKEDLIKSLYNSIDTYIQEKKAMAKEIMTLRRELSEVQNENETIKQDNAVLKDAYDNLQSYNMKLQTKEIKLSEIMSILNKEDISIIKDDKDYDCIITESIDIKDEESLSGICFPDKVKSENKIQTNDSIIPALDFGNIHEDLEDKNKQQRLQLKNLCKANEKKILLQEMNFQKISKLTSNLFKPKGSFMKKIDK